MGLLKKQCIDNRFCFLLSVLATKWRSEGVRGGAKLKITYRSIDGIGYAVKQNRTNLSSSVHCYVATQTSIEVVPFLCISYIRAAAERAVLHRFSSSR
jgi:hypothetical protein